MDSWPLTKQFSRVRYYPEKVCGVQKLTCAYQTHGTRKRFLVALLRLRLFPQSRSSLYVGLLHNEVYMLTPLKGNAGDSRSVLGVKGRAKPLSFDHKPQNEGKDYCDHLISTVC